MIEKTFMVFDVESIGLHGEGFAVGYVVVESRHGDRLGSGLFSCNPNEARGTWDGHEWVDGNVPTLDETHKTPREVRTAFWDAWLNWQAHGAYLVADCFWPVEARFLVQCVDDLPERAEQGPYPLLELSSILLRYLLDPIATVDRYPDELPKHNPLCDARQSARVLCHLLKKGMPT